MAPVLPNIDRPALWGGAYESPEPSSSYKTGMRLPPLWTREDGRNLGVKLDKCYETLSKVLEVNTTHHILVRGDTGGRGLDLEYFLELATYAICFPKHALT